jgi:hypothetical protein
MKLRILDDSIRLRLDRDEVERLGTGGAVESATRFPSGASLLYRLNAGAEALATYVNGTITVTLPQRATQHWAATESEVSIRASLPLDGGKLAILVEKDFECLAPRDGESQANRFRNPNAC